MSSQVSHTKNFQLFWTVSLVQGWEAHKFTRLDFSVPLIRTAESSSFGEMNRNLMHYHPSAF